MPTYMNRKFLPLQLCVSPDSGCSLYRPVVPVHPKILELPASERHNKDIASEALVGARENSRESINALLDCGMIDSRRAGRYVHFDDFWHISFREGELMGLGCPFDYGMPYTMEVVPCIITNAVARIDGRKPAPGEFEHLPGVSAIGSSPESPDYVLMDVAGMIEYEKRPRDSRRQISDEDATLDFKALAAPYAGLLGALVLRDWAIAYNNLLLDIARIGVFPEEKAEDGKPAQTVALARMK